MALFFSYYSSHEQHEEYCSCEDFFKIWLLWLFVVMKTGYYPPFLRRYHRCTGKSCSQEDWSKVWKLEGLPAAKEWKLEGKNLQNY